MNLRPTSHVVEKSAPFPILVRPIDAPTLAVALLALAALVVAEPQVPRALALAARLFLAL
jgi:hypothetical protein